MKANSRNNVDNVEVGKYISSVAKGLDYMANPEFDPTDPQYQQAIVRAEQQLGRRLDRIDITKQEYEEQLQKIWSSSFMQALHELYNMRTLRPKDEAFEHLMLHYNDRPDIEQ